MNTSLADATVSDLPAGTRPLIIGSPDTAWNTVYLDAALAALRAQGHPVLDADAVRLSPYMRRHLNVHGHYTFTLPELAGARRALRDPDAGDEDSDNA